MGRTGMADKSTLEAIDKLKRQRPRQLLDMVDAPIAVMTDFTTSREGLVQGLRFLVEDFRAQAELVMDSGARGKGAEATALRSVASQLSLLADAVAKVDIDGPAEALPLPSRGGPPIPAQWCGDQYDHGPHDWPSADVAAPGAGRHCTGHHARDLSGLDALVAERAAGQGGSYGIGPDETSVITFADPAPLPPAGFYPTDPPDDTQADIDVGDLHEAMVRRDGEMEAWLSGETNTMPPIRNDRAEWEPTPVTDQVEPVAAVAEWQPYRTNTPELKEAASVIFADPAPLALPAPDMPGRRLSWAEARQAPTAAAAEHLSFSQGGTLDECGMQYRLQRLEPEVVQRPHWANVGGTALHACAEWFELQVSKAPGDAGYAKARIEIAGGVKAIWAQHLAAALTAQVLATPGVPPATWKAGGRGQSEGWTWWQVEGEDMLRRYLDGRIRDMDLNGAPELAFASDGKPMVELEGVLDVEGVPYKVVIDQVWRGESFGLPPGSLVIDDLKSGAYAPKGTYQLGGYAWYLRLEQDAEQVYGRFWDARKGAYSEPVNLLEAHPWDEVVMRVHAQNGKKVHQLYAPAPDWSRCGGCSVKHACPAALTRG
jgi:hypothetical protein